jgi:hypothetical protein
MSTFIESDVSELNSRLAWMFAPFSTRNFTTLRCPFREAKERLVYPSFSKIQVSTHDRVRSFRAELTASIDICTFLHQELHNLEVTILGCQV